MIRVDEIRIDTDEGRFVLYLDGEPYDIHAVALELEAQVRRELRPYAIEAEHALAFDEGAECENAADELGEGYEPTDPKSDGYFDRLATLHDSRGGK